MTNSEAEEYKEKGNAAFKERDYDKAIKEYNKAITLDPTNATYYSNRSGAWSSKGNHDSALADAKKCVETDSNFIKGYSRKGKALFDLGRHDEAEAAYQEGLSIDPNNDACSKGITDVKSARQRAKAASSRSRGSGGGGMFGGLGELGGFLPKLMEKFKGGGKMQRYLMIFLAYYAFKQFTGMSKSSTSKESSSRHETSGDDDEAGESPATVVGQMSRAFMQGNDMWFSYLQVPSDSETSVLMLHRSSLSAATEYGKVIEAIASDPPQGGLPRIFAPDRPCHGYSPCPSNGEPTEASKWLHQLLATKHSKRLALVATGREAVQQALTFAQQRPEATQMLLINPQSAAPTASSMSTAKEIRAWLETREDAITAHHAADAAHWVAAGGAAKRLASGALTVGKIPKGLKVTILYGGSSKEDEELSQALEAKGAKVQVRNEADNDVHDAILDEMQSMTLVESETTELADE